MSLIEALVVVSISSPTFNVGMVGSEWLWGGQSEERIHHPSRRIGWSGLGVQPALFPWKLIDHVDVLEDSRIKPQTVISWPWIVFREFVISAREKSSPALHHEPCSHIRPHSTEPPVLSLWELLSRGWSLSTDPGHMLLSEGAEVWLVTLDSMLSLSRGYLTENTNCGLHRHKFSLNFSKKEKLKTF